MDGLTPKQTLTLIILALTVIAILDAAMRAHSEEVLKRERVQYIRETAIRYMATEEYEKMPYGRKMAFLNAVEEATKAI